MHIKQTHISIARPNLLKEHVFPTHGLIARIKHENTTMCIVHKGFRGFRAASPASILGGNLIGLKPAIPYDTIHQPLAIINMKRPTLALLLLLVACTPNKQKDINPSVEITDWADFENIFILRKPGVETKLGLTFFENDSLLFRLESFEEICTLNFQGMAISPIILFSTDHFENENHDTHLIDNYLLQNDDVYINIGVEIDCTSVWVEFINDGDLFECVPDLAGILKKE